MIRARRKGGAGRSFGQSRCRDRTPPFFQEERSLELGWPQPPRASRPFGTIGGCVRGAWGREGGAGRPRGRSWRDEALGAEPGEMVPGRLGYAGPVAGRVGYFCSTACGGSAPAGQATNSGVQDPRRWRKGADAVRARVNLPPFTGLPARAVGGASRAGIEPALQTGTAATHHPANEARRRMDVVEVVVCHGSLGDGFAPTLLRPRHGIRGRRQPAGFALGGARV